MSVDVELSGIAMALSQIATALDASELTRIANALETLAARVCKRCEGTGQGRHRERGFLDPGHPAKPPCLACKGRGY